MDLGTDRDAHRGRPARDEQGAGQPGEAGAEAGPHPGRGDKRAVRPGHDHAKPGYAPRLASADTAASLCLPRNAVLA